MNDYLPPNLQNYITLLNSLYSKKTKQITFQVTEDCCLNCTYCYQHHKTHNHMSFETAKIFIDQLLNNQIEFYKIEDTQTLVFEFIGGEPLLEIELMTQILEYSIKEMIKMHHPWLTLFRFSICSNGILYFNEKVQNFLHKYNSWCSLSITIDGNKELHDSCRVDYNGNGSYDRVLAAVKDYQKKYKDLPGNKFTIAPQNIEYLYDAVINLIKEGYKTIPLNCVYEDVWQPKHAVILYEQMIKIADYLIDNDLYNQVFVSLFHKLLIHPHPLQKSFFDTGVCGGTRMCMLALDYQGKIYSCIRFMESSLNGKQKALPIGDIYNGLLSTDEYKENYHILTDPIKPTDKVEKCLECEFSTCCSWCSGYSYEEYGSPKRRTTYICNMHDARVKANNYYWNKLFKKLNIKEE